MKRLLLASFRLAWRGLGPIRGAVHRRLDAWFFDRFHARSLALSAELLPSLHALLREVARLQRQVDALQAAIDDRGAQPSAETRSRAG